MGFIWIYTELIERGEREREIVCKMYSETVSEQ